MTVLSLTFTKNSYGFLTNADTEETINRLATPVALKSMTLDEVTALFYRILELKPALRK